MRKININNPEELKRFKLETSGFVSSYGFPYRLDDMTEKEKENRINSFALSFLGQQQIVPNLYADQIIRGYKEGYHQAEKDLKVEMQYHKDIEDAYKAGFELGLKARKGE